MRLFTAILLDREIKNTLIRAQKELMTLGVTGNYTTEDNLHLTLAFIGEYDDTLHLVPDKTPRYGDFR